MRSPEDALDVDRRRMDGIRINLAGLDEFLNLRNRDSGGSGHHRIKVAGCFLIDEVTERVALPCLDEGEVCNQAALHDVHASIELACFLSFGDDCPVARGRIERRYPRPACADSFRERSLGIQFQLDLAFNGELLEEMI